MRASTEMEALMARVSAGEGPASQLTALRELRGTLDAIEAELAVDAVRAGMSWRQIGAALGISKQAAHRRHHERVAHRLADPAPATEIGPAVIGGAVRISAPARRAVRVARYEAAVLGSAELGTGHLLLGVLQCGDERAERLFERIDVTVARARLALRDGVDPPPDVPDAQPRKLPRADATAAVSPLARRLIERALAAVAARDSRELTALDLLHALLSSESSGAARTLSKLGIAPARVRAELRPLEAQRPASAALRQS